MKSTELKALAFLLLVIAIILARSGVIERWNWARLRKKVDKAVYAEAERREEIAKAEVIDISRGVTLAEVIPLAERYSVKYLPKDSISLAVTAEEHPDHWVVPMLVRAARISLTINKKTGAITCAGYPSVGSPGELRIEQTGNLREPAVANDRSVP